MIPAACWMLLQSRCGPMRSMGSGASMRTIVGWPYCRELRLGVRDGQLRAGLNTLDRRARCFMLFPLLRPQHCREAARPNFKAFDLAQVVVI